MRPPSGQPHEIVARSLRVEYQLSERGLRVPTSAGPDVSRGSLAVEPMTCPPQAFRTGEGVIVLAPGDSMTASWGLTAA